LAHSYAELARAKAEGVPNVQPSASSAYMDDWGRLRSNSLIGRYGRPDAPAPLMISGHAQVDTKRSSRHNGRGMAGTSYNQKSPDASSGEPVESEAKMTNNGNPWRRCVICLDAAVEGACVPCEHMAFCMPCLKEWGVPYLPRRNQPGYPPLSGLRSRLGKLAIGTFPISSDGDVSI
jgi:hypothetical protein